MSSRDHILRDVRANRPSPVDLPNVPSFPAPDGDLAHLFEEMILAIGGRVKQVKSTLAAAVAEAYPDVSIVASTVEGVTGAVTLGRIEDPHAFADLDLLVCRGFVGVAENGAVWVPESHVVHRAAPFLAQHLALVLRRQDIVWNMHQAYERIGIDKEGFGLFVAGPSKTADIEQSLVIGAHGPRSLTVVLV